MSKDAPKFEKFLASIMTISWSKALFFIFLGYFILATGFALIYLYGNIIPDASNIISCLYFSVVTQTTLGFGEFHPVNELGYIVVILHTTTCLFFFVISTSIVVFKLIRAPQRVFVFDENVVFYKDSGVLRFRVYNKSKFPIINVTFKCFIHTWLGDEITHPRYALFDVSVVRGTIPIMKPMDPWLIKTSKASRKFVNLKSGEADREIKFTPNQITDKVEIILSLDGHPLEGGCQENRQNHSFYLYYQYSYYVS